MDEETSLKKNARNSPIPATSVAIKPSNRIKAPAPKQLAAKNKREAPSPAKPLLNRNGKKVLTTKPSPSPTIR